MGILKLLQKLSTFKKVEIYLEFFMNGLLRKNIGLTFEVIWDDLEAILRGLILPRMSS